MRFAPNVYVLTAGYVAYQLGNAVSFAVYMSILPTVPAAQRGLCAGWLTVGSMSGSGRGERDSEGVQGGHLNRQVTSLPGPLPMYLHTVYMEYSECLPTLLNPLAERTRFSQAGVRRPVRQRQQRRHRCSSHA